MALTQFCNLGRYIRKLAVNGTNPAQLAGMRNISCDISKRNHNEIFQDPVAPNPVGGKRIGDVLGERYQRPF